MNILLPRRLLLTWLGALWFAFASLACADDAKPASDAQAKAEITKMLNDFLTFNSDPAQHDRWWADDLVYTSSAGLVRTKAMIMQSFAGAANATTPKAEPRPAYSAEDVLVRLYGDTAALTFRLVAHNADGSIATFRNSGTLLRRHGRWQVVTWQATKEPAPAK